jgi:hypothetical protein
MKPTTRLALIALAATLASAGSFGGAYALATTNDSGSTEIATRELPWDGATSLSLGVRSVVRYVQTEGEGRIVARGPHRSVSTLVVSSGEIHDQLLHTGATLEITVFAPAISEFHVNGRSRLSIEAYDQDHLSVTTEGGAIVDAAGRASNVSIDMKGAGVVNLSKLAAESAVAQLRGMSTLVLAPSAKASLDVRNFASAVLLSRPGVLSTSLADSGRVVDAAAR